MYLNRWSVGMNMRLGNPRCWRLRNRQTIHGKDGNVVASEQHKQAMKALLEKECGKVQRTFRVEATFIVDDRRVELLCTIEASNFIVAEIKAWDFMVEFYENSDVIPDYSKKMRVYEIKKEGSNS